MEYNFTEDIIDIIKQKTSDLFNKLDKSINDSNTKILQEDSDDLHLEILKLLKNHKKLAISDICKLIKANRNTFLVKLRNLVEMKKIKTFGKGRGVVYEI